MENAIVASVISPLAPKTVEQYLIRLAAILLRSCVNCPEARSTDSWVWPWLSRHSFS
jgi:hypothetical protein